MTTTAIEHKEHFHGSDLEKIEKVYGIKKEDIISFSANVNPLGLSEHLRQKLAKKLDAITTYPDREYTKLRQTIATYCNTDYQNIVVGNGSTELISLMIQLRAPKEALIVAPTYSEYEREVSLQGGQVSYFPLCEKDDFRLDTDSLLAQITSDINLLVLCNPNNPTSSAIFTTDMEKIAKHCKQTNTLVMVDETYIEFAENYEEIASIPLTKHYDNLVILRGISKFFAAPGLRLGYAITGSKELISHVNEKKNPWTINSLAEVAGTLMFTDAEYIRATKELIATERKRICDKLATIPGLKVYPPSANFVLVKIEKATVNADILFEAAIQKCMMIRNCASFAYLDESYFRFCFMQPSDNDTLLSCIEEVMMHA
ncbi:MAG: threonine-phosphate decarboxylase [Lachnospiraceae bacterium]|nr:threonine-phosphate decarboxylase [Lachnospiraceae bacterium]